MTKTTGVRPSAKTGGDAERVVDRRADVAVGGREERGRAEDALEPCCCRRRRAPRDSTPPGPVSLPRVKIFVIGAGQVGSTIVEALHDEHDVTVIDLDPAG